MLSDSKYGLPSAKAYINTTGYSFPLTMFTRSQINTALRGVNVIKKLVRSGFVATDVSSTATTCVISGITVSTTSNSISNVSCAGTLYNVSALTHQFKRNEPFKF